MELKDYLHLYGIGSAISTVDGNGTILSLHSRAVTVSLDQILSSQILNGFNAGNGGLHRTYLYKDYDCKPILRPLDSMTKDEAIELSKLSEWDPYIQDIVAWQSREEIQATRPLAYYAAQFQYLLNHHFDLFGLIPAGLALPKQS